MIDPNTYGGRETGQNLARILEAHGHKVVTRKVGSYLHQCFSELKGIAEISDPLVRSRVASIYVRARIPDLSLDEYVFESGKKYRDSEISRTGKEVEELPKRVLAIVRERKRDLLTEARVLDNTRGALLPSIVTVLAAVKETMVRDWFIGPGQRAKAALSNTIEALQILHPAKK